MQNDEPAHSPAPSRASLWREPRNASPGTVRHRRFIILQPDASYGRGARGANLARFLRIFHGTDAVEMLRVRDLEKGPARHADVLFIGVPSGLQQRHLDRLTCRRVVLFDYTDKAGPDWQGSDEALLRSLSGLYLKAWVEPGWNFGLRWGVLPIRRYPQLTWHVRILRGLFRARYPGLFRRDHDVSFLGNCTAYVGTGAHPRYPQRIEWLSELYHARERFSFWGGLQASSSLRAKVWQQHGDVSHLLYPRGRCLFTTFFRHLLRSKIVLTPTGNARWTYRHYEAIYAGALLVTTDFRPVRTLIPLPPDGVVHVPDHEPVIPAVERGLELLRTRPQLPRENIAFLERFLTHGDYDRAKPALLEKFLAQLE